MATLQMYMNESKIENTFESPVYREVWGDDFGVPNAIGKIKKIAVHRPGKELEWMKQAKYEEEAGSLILKDEKGIELIVIDMPAFYIHLDETFIPVDKDKILCSTFILPFWFLKMMQDRGYKIIETDRDDPFLTNNCLTLEPGKVLFSAKGVRTIKNLEAAGVEVIPVDISEINKLGGGIHCSTLELKREEV